MVLEVSSHSLDQYRLLGCCFAVSVITNFSREHLDYHNNLDDYLKTKAKLFLVSKKKVFNEDDCSLSYLSSRFSDYTTYSLKKDVDLNLKKVDMGLNFKEEFNQYNALASIAVCGELGVGVCESVEALADFSRPPGRQEVIQEKPFMVMNDFAHTPNGLKQLFVSIKPFSGKLIHVFGCPGKRDKGKRRLMGRISSDCADVIILTAEDPRDEPIEKINEEISSGISKSFLGKLIMIENRAEAIERAIGLAKKGDVILCTGKGAERTQEYSDRVIEWDESGVIRSCLKKL